MMPDFMSNLHFWGGAGVMIKAIHFNGAIPYWTSIALFNVSVRTGLFPFVIYSAHNASRFAKVAPEVQFAITVFQNDLKKSRAEGTSPKEQARLFRQVLELISGLYKLHSVNPLSVFISPLCQIPIFWYFSVDLRKIINGADPGLAQQLTEGGMLWFPDLTNPDPWFVLPVLSGLLLYYNVEVAVGKASLSGEVASKSNLAMILKDAFQSLAIFMPGFVSQSPAGVQIYLLTSFTFTLFQSYALRSDTFRKIIGLPLKSSEVPIEPIYAKGFIELKKWEKKAIAAWGNRPMPGDGIMAAGFKIAMPGRKRPSTIKGSGIQPLDLDDMYIPTPRMQIPQQHVTFIHGISAPIEEMPFAVTEPKEEKHAPTLVTTMNVSDLDMERANRGEVPLKYLKKIEPDVRPNELNLKRFKLQSTKKKGVGKKR